MSRITEQAQQYSATLAALLTACAATMTNEDPAAVDRLGARVLQLSEQLAAFAPAPRVIANAVQSAMNIATVALEAVGEDPYDWLTRYELDVTRLDTCQ